MNLRFNVRRGIILVPVKLFGPAGDRVVRLALDTGATHTMIASNILINLGYAPWQARRWMPVMTASGNMRAPVIYIRSIEALGLAKTRLNVICHTLPPNSSIDGLLGLNFFKECRLTIDFRRGLITVR